MQWDWKAQDKDGEDKPKSCEDKQIKDGEDKLKRCEDKQNKMANTNKKAVKTSKKERGKQYQGTAIEP